MSTGAAGRCGRRRTSLPLLISLFLAALIGVFPIPATAGAPLTASASSVLAGAADRPAAGTPSTEHRAGADHIVADLPVHCATRAASAPGARTDVRAAAGQDVRAATAPRAPPLHLV